MACRTASGSRSRRRGFTLIELLVVLAVIATLLSIALPRYFTSLDKAREATLRQSLAVVREAIDKFYADRARYPMDLQELERSRYLRAVPVDPMTDSAATWVLVPPPAGSGAQGAVYDLHSGAAMKALDGSDVASW
jgi:general secretion pathway protein G